jgi:alkylhydroperoxidase family enzyme
MTILDTKVFATITGTDPEQVWEAIFGCDRISRSARVGTAGLTAQGCSP